MDSYEKEVYIQTIKDAIGNERLTHFAARAGLSAGNLSRIRNGQIANATTLRKIADASSTVSFEELLRAAGIGDVIRDSRPHAPKQGMVRIPTVKELVYDKATLKDDPALVWGDYYRDAFGNGDFIFFVANDNALSSKFHAEDKVLVDLAKRPQDDDAVLFRLNGSQSLLRRLKKSGKNYIYYGDDKFLYPMTTVPQSEVEIYGVAVQAIVRV